MNERDQAIVLANRILDRPSGDPDDDLAVLSRQYLRLLEVSAMASCDACQILDVVKQEWGGLWSARDSDVRHRLGMIAGWYRGNPHIRQEETV